MKKITSILVLLGTLIIVLSACGPNYQGTYIFEGTVLTRKLTLKGNDQVELIEHQDGFESDTSTGKYSIKGNKINIKFTTTNGEKIKGVFLMDGKITKDGNIDMGNNNIYIKQNN